MRIAQTVYEVIDGGVYPAKLVDCEEHDGNWGPYLKLFFELQDGDHAGVNLTAVASARFSNRAKLYLWTKALLGARRIPRDYDFDIADVIGKRCLLRVDVVDNGDGEFNRVTDVIAAPQAKPAPKPAPVKAPDDWERPDDGLPEAPPPWFDDEESGASA